MAHRFVFGLELITRVVNQSQQILATSDQVVSIKKSLDQNIGLGAISGPLCVMAGSRTNAAEAKARMGMREAAGLTAPELSPFNCHH